MSKEQSRCRSILHALGTTLVAALAGGCQYPIDVHSAWASGDVSPPGPSFAWMPGPAPSTGNTEIDNPQLHRLIRELVEEQLLARGYRKASSETPDFRVGDRIGTEILGDPNTAYLQQYTRGTLVIYVVNAKTDQWIWRAWADARISESNTPELRRQRLEQTVKRMFKDFPPREGKRLAR